MANPTGSNAVAGKIAKTGIYEAVSRGVIASETITRGDVVHFDVTNGYAEQGASGDQMADGGGVAMISADNSGGQSGDIVVTVAIGNSWVYVKAGGTIKPMSLVKVNDATTVVAHIKPVDNVTPTGAAVNSARDYFGLTFGRYMGHQLQARESTAAASTDVIIVRLGV